MFIKKDLRKIPAILAEAQTAIDEDKEASFLKDLRLGRRQNEFQGSIRILCQPQNAPSLVHLQSLSLFDCQIQSLEGIGMLDVCPKLETLNLGSNPLQSLPDECSRLSSSLKELLLDDCQLTGPFPGCLLKLEQLRSLRMSNNKITTLPSDIQKLVHLKALCMDRNELTRVPKELQEMEHLETLLLRHNQIQMLPCGVPGSSMKKLAMVHISSNPLKSLPESVVDCTSITHLYANSNKLTEVPLGMERLVNLKHLNLSHNRIDYLSSDFRSCFGMPPEKSPSGVCTGGTHPNGPKVLLLENPVLTAEEDDTNNNMDVEETLEKTPNMKAAPIVEATMG